MKKIFHISDIHIRLYQRHAEYQRVFDEFYRILDNRHTPGDIIVIAGDVVHSKNEMSPELLKITSNFLKNCADRMPTILILGNHDLNLQNSTRMDVLTPIVELLNHPQLYFWRETGVYSLDGIHFSVMSVLDPPDKWPRASILPSGKKIALHHGAVHGSMTDLSHMIQNETVRVDLFDGFDLVLLGDIHKHQYLDQSRRIAYSSSPIQQNQGESLSNHGIIIWNLDDFSSEFVPLNNDYGYFTFEINNGKWENPTTLPKYVRARVRYANSSIEQVAEIVKSNSSQYLDIIYENLDQTAGSSSSTIHDNFHDVEYQNSLICDFLRDIYAPDDEILDAIRHINREINSSLVSKSHPNFIWHLKSFEFSNMFSYGENNFIDFEKMSGVYGLFAPNAAGKTSLLSSLSFCLFDKCPVGSKGIYVLNNLKDEFKCKVSFSIGSDIYTIERRGTRTPKSVRVDVDFWKEHPNGDIENLNGEDRDGTNKNIREIIGTYEDFVMVTLSTQLDNQSFIEKTQKERKELLYRFLNLSVFEELWNKGKEILKEKSIHLSGIDVVKLTLQESEITEELSRHEIQLELLKKREEDLRIQMRELDEEIRSRYMHINETIENIDIDDILIKIEKNQQEQRDLLVIIEKIIADIGVLENQVSNFVSSKDEIDQIEIQVNHLTEVSKNNSILQRTLDKLNFEIKSCEEKINHLSKHEYDPNCRFCIRNPFVIDATSAKEKIGQLLEKRSKIENEIRSNGDCSEIGALKSKSNLLKELERIHLDRSNKIKFEHERLMRAEQRQINLQNEYEQLTNQKLKYEQQEVSILKNKLIQSEISSLEYRQNAIESEIHKMVRPDIERTISEIAKCEEKIGKIRSDISRFNEYKSVCNIYEMYVKATSKEGVPYRILSSIIPSLETNINRYLNSFCDFNIKFEMVDDKNINANVIYSERKFWPIELSSGMERFIIGQVIRMGLMSISNLPRPNFVAIDEGFGVLDSENLNSIGMLFSHMKDNSKLILCISHIDALKDAVDDSFFVENENGFSKIRYEGE